MLRLRTGDLRLGDLLLRVVCLRRGGLLLELRRGDRLRRLQHENVHACLE